MIHRFAALFGMALLAASVSLPAYAATIIWSFDGVANDVKPGIQQVTGFFDYSTVTHMITFFDIQASGAFSDDIHGPASIHGDEVFFGNFEGSDPLVLALAVSNLAGPNNIELGSDSFIGQFDNGTPNSFISLAGRLDFKDPPDSPSPTPLPDTLLLFGGGLIGLLGFAALRR